MATKDRHKVIAPGAHTEAGVKRYASDYGVSVDDAWKALAQYALNRIATLARNAAKKPKKEKKPKAAKPKKEKKPKANAPKAAA